MTQDVEANSAAIKNNTEVDVRIAYLRTSYQDDAGKTKYNWKLEFAMVAPDNQDYKNWLRATRSYTEYESPSGGWLRPGETVFVDSEMEGDLVELRLSSVRPAEGKVLESEVNDAGFFVFCECSGSWWICPYAPGIVVDCESNPPCDRGKQIISTN